MVLNKILEIYDNVLIKLTKFKLAFLAIFLLINFYFIFTNIYSLIVSLSFLVNFLAITYGFIKAVKIKQITIDTVYWIFNYLFFIIAPITQMNSDVFANHFPVREHIVLNANLIIFVWNILFIAFRKYKEVNYDTNHIIEYNEFNRKVVYIITAISFVLSILYFGINMSIEKMYEVMYYKLNENNSITLLVDGFLTGIVYLNFIFAALYVYKHKKIDLYALISALMFILTINPLNQARNFIGFVGVSFLVIFFNKRITSITFSVLLLFGIFFVFPFLNIFRFGFATFTIAGYVDSALVQFKTLHFDAYANFLATIHYVDYFGIIWGQNILTSLLFFVPRSIWPGKFVGTGHFIGILLVEGFGLGIDNISNPLISEMYIAFGYIGIIVAPILLALGLNLLDKHSRNWFLLYSVITGYILFILRGQLLASYSYAFNAVVMIVFLPRILNYLNKKLNLNKRIFKD